MHPQPATLKVVCSHKAIPPVVALATKDKNIPCVGKMGQGMPGNLASCNLHQFASTVRNLANFLIFKLSQHRRKNTVISIQMSRWEPQKSHLFDVSSHWR